MIFIDSSVFLVLYLDEPGAGDAKEILENVETNKVEGVITPLVLEEVTFKVIFKVLNKVKSHIDALEKGG